jgi:hypothetical protein
LSTGTIKTTVFVGGRRNTYRSSSPGNQVSFPWISWWRPKIAAVRLVSDAEPGCTFPPKDTHRRRDKRLDLRASRLANTYSIEFQATVNSQILMAGYAMADFGVGDGVKSATEGGPGVGRESGREEGPPNAHGCVPRTFGPESKYESSSRPSSLGFTATRGWADWIFG